mgnify:CR=1 FL=1
MTGLDLFGYKNKKGQGMPNHTNGENADPGNADEAGEKDSLWLRLLIGLIPWVGVLVLFYMIIGSAMSDMKERQAWQAEHGVLEHQLHERDQAALATLARAKRGDLLNISGLVTRDAKFYEVEAVHANTELALRHGSDMPLVVPFGDWIVRGTFHPKVELFPQGDARYDEMMTRYHDQFFAERICRR